MAVSSLREGRYAPGPYVPSWILSREIVGNLDVLRDDGRRWPRSHWLLLPAAGVNPSRLAAQPSEANADGTGVDIPTIGTHGWCTRLSRGDSGGSARGGWPLRIYMIGRNYRGAETRLRADAARRFTSLAGRRRQSGCMAEVIQTLLWQPPVRGRAGGQLAESDHDVAALRAEITALWRSAHPDCRPHGGEYAMRYRRQSDRGRTARRRHGPGTLTIPVAMSTWASSVPARTATPTAPSNWFRRSWRLALLRDIFPNDRADSSTTNSNDARTTRRTSSYSWRRTCSSAEVDDASFRPGGWRLT